MMMKERDSTMKKQSIIRSILAAELVLLVPLIAMQFSDEWDWKLSDFIIIGMLLAGVGFAYQLIVNGLKSNFRHAIMGFIIAAVMILLWVELAVGIFGSPIAGS
jgi:mannose/fructose/N-acetylgalactosamine-specific phosphotransferase system component IIC